MAKRLWWRRISAVLVAIPLFAGLTVLTAGGAQATDLTSYVCRNISVAGTDPANLHVGGYDCGGTFYSVGPGTITQLATGATYHCATILGLTLAGFNAAGFQCSRVQ
jgi:hypothetical protein